MTPFTPTYAAGYLQAEPVAARARTVGRANREVRAAFRAADRAAAAGDSTTADYYRGAALRWSERGCEIDRAPHTNNRAAILEALTPTPATGYVCKRCGAPSPVGVGYAAAGDKTTAAAALAVTSCPCGWSRLPGEVTPA